MKYLPLLLGVLLLIVRYTTTRPIYHEGDRVRVSSEVTSLTKIAGLRIKFPPGSEINYGDYVVVEGKVKNGELSNPIIKETKASNNILINIRQKLINSFKNSLPILDGELVGGIVIGAKSDLDKDFYNKLINTGTSHVVVASGMNVTMTAGFIMALLLNFMARRKAIFITLIAILIYCYIAGFEAPIVRAAIMSFFAFSAQLLGRVVSTIRILFITAFIMLFITPDWLTDISFILSFSTTLSMILFEAKINRLIHFVPSILKDSLSTSLSAQILAAPIIFFTFGRINLFSPLINAMVLWTVSPIMIIGGVGAIISLIIPSVGEMIILLAYPLTRWFITVVSLLG